MAGWEDRFLLGINDYLEKTKVDSINVIIAYEYENFTSDNIASLQVLCDEKAIKLKEIKISIKDNIDSWKKLEKEITKQPNETVLFDISTTPREIIWYVQHFLHEHSAEVDYVYSKPRKYGEWLCKDPGKPRFVFYHSGITNLELPTALFIISGFDLDRAAQLVHFYEPKKVFLAIQVGEQFENNFKNRELHIEKLKRYTELEYFELDLFATDAGLKSLRERLPKLTEQYNLVATSLGPKPSAVSLFEIQKTLPQLALCYVPSQLYNTKEYSKGYDGFRMITFS